VNYIAYHNNVPVLQNDDYEALKKTVCELAFKEQFKFYSLREENDDGLGPCKFSAEWTRITDEKNENYGKNILKTTECTDKK